MKAEVNLRAKILRSFVTRYGMEKGYRVSLAGFKDQGWVENVPLYALELLPGLDRGSSVKLLGDTRSFSKRHLGPILYLETTHATELSGVACH